MKDFFTDLSDDINQIGYHKPISFSGKVNQFDGNIIQCDGFPAHVGTLCKVQISFEKFVTAEIIGFNNGQNILSLYESGSQIKVGAVVTTIDEGSQISVAENLLGRVIDALGKPLDEKLLPKLAEKWPPGEQYIAPLTLTTRSPNLSHLSYHPRNSHGQHTTRNLHKLSETETNSIKTCFGEKTP